MKTNIKIWMVVIVAAFMIQSCAKEEGVGGKKEINGTVMFTDGAAAGAIVYINYGATTDDGTYDQATVTDATGKYKFDGLQLGDYFIDAEYTDSYGIEFNTAGVHINVGDKKNALTVDLNLN